MKHYNPSIAEESLRRLNTKIGDHMPDEVGGPFAVIPILPVCRIVRSGSTGSTTLTIFTTPADKDFYLTAAQLSVIKDVTATSTSSTINVIIDGVNQNVLRIGGITLTPQSEAVANTFNPPIKIDRGTAITIQNTTNTAVILAQGSIVGYTQEVVRT